MKTQGKQLFGGALVAAGIAVGGAAQTAHADAFTIVNGYAWASADFTGFDSGYPTATDTFSYMASTSNTTSTASSDGCSILLNSESQYIGFGVAYAALSLIATTDGTLSIAWDFSADNYGQSYVYVYNYTTFEYIFENAGTGKVYLDVEVGDVIRFEGLSASSAAAVGKSFISVTIPAPGALALLGLAAIAGRRRRRE